MSDRLYTPFTRADAMESGISAWQWHNLTKSGRLVRLHRGVYAQSTPSEDRLAYLQQVAARLLKRSNHYAVGASALAVHDLPNPHFKSWSRLPVQLGGRKSRPQRGIRRTRWAPIDSQWGPVTDLIDTAVTIAAELPLPQALMVTVAVARRIAETTSRFELASERCRTEVRRRLTEDSDLPALRLANPASESPAESFYRGQMILDKFPEPACGVPRRGASGAQYFIDLLLEGLAIEVDGRGKYTDLQILIDEKVREDDLRATGLTFHRPFVEDLYADPATQMRLLHDKQAEIRRSQPWAS
jgi:hypothetical protein